MAKADRLMDEAQEMLEDARSLLKDAVEMIPGISAEFQAVSVEDRKEFDDQLREFRRQAAATKNQDRPKTAPKDAPKEPVEPAADWKKTDPLMFLRVDVTGRSNFGILLRSAFRLLFAGKSTFVFKKPVKL